MPSFSLSRNPLVLNPGHDVYYDYATWQRVQAQSQQQPHHQPVPQAPVPTQYPAGYAACDGMAGSSAQGSGNAYAPRHVMAQSNAQGGIVYAPGPGMAPITAQGGNVYAYGGNTQHGNWSGGHMHMGQSIEVPLQHLHARNMQPAQGNGERMCAAPLQQYGQVYHHGHSGHVWQGHNRPWGLTDVGPSHQPPQQQGPVYYHGVSGQVGQGCNGPWGPTAVGPLYQPPPQPVQVAPRVPHAAQPQQQSVQNRTKDDEPGAPVAPLVSDPSRPAASTPASTTTASATPEPRKPYPWQERLAYMRKHINRMDHEVECELLTSWAELTIMQKRNYCNEYWATNEEALANLHEMATLSPRFSFVHTFMLGWESKTNAAHAIKDEAERAEALATVEAAFEAEIMEQKAKCKIELSIMKLNHEHGQLGATRNSIRGKKQGESRIKHNDSVNAKQDALRSEIAELTESLGMTIAQRVQKKEDAAMAKAADLLGKRRAVEQVKAQIQERGDRERAEKEEKKKAATAVKDTAKALKDAERKEADAKREAGRQELLMAKWAEIQPPAKAQPLVRNTGIRIVNKKRKGQDDEAASFSSKRAMTEAPQQEEEDEASLKDVPAASDADSDDEDSASDAALTPGSSLPQEDDASVEDILAAFDVAPDDSNSASAGAPTPSSSSQEPAAQPQQHSEPLPAPVVEEAEQLQAALPVSSPPQEDDGPSLDILAGDDADSENEASPDYVLAAFDADSDDEGSASAGAPTPSSSSALSASSLFEGNDDDDADSLFGDSPLP